MQATTPAALDMVGREMATTGASQKRVVELIAERTGAKIGVPKLRRMTANLVDQMSPFREHCQLELLRALTDQAIKEVKKNNEKPVLSISRDGVSTVSPSTECSSTVRQLNRFTSIGKYDANVILIAQQGRNWPCCRRRS